LDFSHILCEFSGHWHKL